VIFGTELAVRGIILHNSHFSRTATMKRPVETTDDFKVRRTSPATPDVGAQEADDETKASKQTANTMSSPKSLESASAMVRLFPEIVTALVSLSALGYYIGWCEASAYYDKLGAPWAISMLPPFALLQLSSTIAVVIGINGFLGFNSLAAGHATPQGLRRLSLIIVSVGAGLYVLATALSKWLSAWQAYAAAFMVALAYAAAAGLIGAELLGHLKLSKWQMNPTYLFLIYWVFYFGLSKAPDDLGRARAAYHLDPAANSLPSVELPGAPANLKWRLVHIADGRALLISPAKERDNCTFRVIDAKDLPSIAALSSTAAK
jgi:hypothetical protein